VHEVKVDRAFVQGVAESPVDSAIVRAVIDLANAMGITTVAEGVETRSQVAGLKMIGCEVAQGFYFSLPLRAEEFDQLLTYHFAPAAGPPGDPGVTPSEPPFISVPLGRGRPSGAGPPIRSRAAL
jgi:predicted signal transduction protein with EAL and GGDEF domain